MKRGVGRNSGGCPPVPDSSAPAPCSSNHSRTSSSKTALTASSSTPGTRLPTSVVKRKSSTTRLHLPLASKSCNFYRSFHLPVSFFTSAHRIFCCGFHSEHSLKRWSRVCVRYWHHQHCGVGRLFVQLRHCPVRQYPICFLLPYPRAAGSQATGTSSWRFGPLPTGVPPPTSSPRFPA